LLEQHLRSKLDAVLESREPREAGNASVAPMATASAGARAEQHT
jgi:hypothetical protein